MDGVDFLLNRLRLWTVLVIGVALIAIVIKNVFYPTPPIPPSFANGVYSNACCGRLMLHDGLMTFAGGKVRYRLLVRKTDLQAETENDVVVSGGNAVRLVFGRNNRLMPIWRAPYRDNSLNRYDARNVPPDRITLYSDDYNGTYDFILVSK